MSDKPWEMQSMLSRTSQAMAAVAAEYPKCWLHNIRLVDAFPPHCPLSTAKHGEALAKLWAAGKEKNDKALIARAMVCDVCVAGTASHQRVFKLREKLANGK